MKGMFTLDPPPHPPEISTIHCSGCLSQPPCPGISINFQLFWVPPGKSADNFKKKFDLDGLTLEPAVWSGDTGQRIPCFDSCQLITTLMCNNQFSLGLPNQLGSVRVSIGFPVVRTDGRSVGVWSRHVITKMSGMGRFPQLHVWGSHGAPLKRLLQRVFQPFVIVSGFLSLPYCGNDIKAAHSWHFNR